MTTPPSWIATRPTDDIDVAAVLGRWGLATGTVEDLPSERDRNLLIRPVGGAAPVVLKVSNLAEDRAVLECQVAAAERLAAAGVPVARPIAALDGATVVGLGDPGPPWARLLPWLPGRPLAEVDRPSPALLADLGRTMGRVATALVGLDHPATHRPFQWDVRRATDVIAGGLDDVDDPDRRALLARTLAGLRARLDPMLPRLRSSLIHNDANDHNVLVDADGERVVGLLDLGDMCHAVTVHEAAVAAAYAMFHHPDPGDVLRPLVGGFDATCPLRESELDALPDLVLARLGASVAISAHQGRLDPDPYLRISEAPAWAVLDRLDTLGVPALRDVVHGAVDR